MSETEVNDLDDSASIIGDHESASDAPVQVVMDKETEKTVVDDELALNQMASMPYRHCRVAVFKKSDRFFYEPLVLLEEITVTRHQRPDGRVEVAFKIKLWDYDLERRILAYLRHEIGEVGVKAHQVQMMPYEEVRLVAKKTSPSFRVPSGSFCLLQLPVEIICEVFFTSEEEAELNANPKYLAKHLELHFKSPSQSRLDAIAKKAGHTISTVRRDSPFRVHRSSAFAINIASQSINSDADNEAFANNFWLEDVLSKIQHVEDTAKAARSSACVPVFRASKYSNVSGGFVTYREVAQWKEDHGTFNKTTGVFTAKSAGMYLFQFQGLPSSYTSVKLRLDINGTSKAESQSCCCGPNYNGYQTQSGSVTISCLLHVKSDDKVGIFLESGSLSETLPNATRFWGILVVADDQDGTNP